MGDKRKARRILKPRKGRSIPKKETTVKYKEARIPKTLQAQIKRKTETDQ